MAKRYYAILSDIHSNYPALLAVARDASAQAGGADLRFISLGDVIDLGPQPNECVAWVQAHVAYAVRGNHDDHASAGLREPLDELTEEYWPITLWTRAALEPGSRMAVHSWRRQFVQLDDLSSFTLYHDSLTMGERGKVADADSAYKEMQHLTTPYGLFGHSHYQSYYEQNGRNATAYYVPPDGTPPPPPRQGWLIAPLDTWKRLPDVRRRCLLNPGSVGQPRRHDVFTGAAPDCRASYLLLRINGHGPGEFSFRRVPYDTLLTIGLLESLTWPPATGDVAGSTITHGARRSLAEAAVDAALARQASALPELIARHLKPMLTCAPE